MQNKKSASKEDYLKTIFEISVENNKKVTTSAIAESLSISPAAVTDMLKKLATDKFVSKNKTEGVLLTETGKRIATNVIRKHRLWEAFLIKVLGLSWTEVHKEAEQLEHRTSDFLIDKIDEYLEYPKTDPHGTVIPSKNGDFFIDPDEIVLSSAELEDDYFVKRIYDKDDDLIRFFDKVKLKIGSKIKVIEKLSFDESLNVCIDGNEVQISKKVADFIFVSKNESR